MSPLYSRWLIYIIYATLFLELLPETGDAFDWHHVSSQATEEQFWPHCLWLFVKTGRECTPSLPVSWFQSKYGFQYSLVCKLGGTNTLQPDLLAPKPRNAPLRQMHLFSCLSEKLISSKDKSLVYKTCSRVFFPSSLGICWHLSSNSHLRLKTILVQSISSAVWSLTFDHLKPEKKRRKLLVCKSK